jgi:PAS domain S-box-containing protein
MKRTLLDHFFAAAMDIPVMVEAYDHKGRLVFWNSAAALISGYTPEEVVGNPKALETMYPDPKYLRRMRRLFARRGGDFKPIIWRMTCKGGETRDISWFNVSSHLKIPGWERWAVGIDVTERMQIETEIKRQQKNLESLIIKNAESRVALRVVLEQLEVETRRVGQNLAYRLDRRVRPFLEKLRAAGLTEAQKNWLELALDNLTQITGDGGLSKDMLREKLSRAEMEVAMMAAKGMTTTEIAGMLNIAEATVSTHRLHIRRKLELVGKNIRLSQALNKTS